MASVSTASSYQRLFLLSLLLAGGLMLPAWAITVTNTNDSGSGSLRDAIDLANATAGSTITFDLAASDPNYVNGTWVIRPLSALPEVLGSNTTIDGSTQPGDTNPNGPEIVLNGSLAGSFDNGFLLTGPNCVVRGFVIQDFKVNGVTVRGTNAIGCRVEGCFIGTDATGTSAVGNVARGITIITGARDTVVGGDVASQGNVISGNGNDGVLINGARDTIVVGNRIGVDRLGNGSLGNGRHGVYVGTSNNKIGSLTAELPNVISGNALQGIYIDRADAVHVIGSLIGLGSDGATSLGNGGGVWVQAPARENVIGGEDPRARNYIAASIGVGVVLFESECQENLVQGNYIGLDQTGMIEKPCEYGVDLTTSRRNTVQGNVISGNRLDGVVTGWAARQASTGNLNNPNENTIKGNIIGLNASGTAAVPNGRSGVRLFHLSWGNTVGGDSEADRNVISGNGRWGVSIGGVLGNATPNGGGKSLANRVVGNWIGPGLGEGSAGLGNTWGGIGIEESSDNHIGGAGPGEGNVISGNRTHGIAIYSAQSARNQVMGNTIGLMPDGLSALPTLSDGSGNFWDGAGINVWNGAQHNNIGGTAPGAGNLISGNEGAGITISGQGTNNNHVQGNLIGVRYDRTAEGNGAVGIAFWNGPRSNRVGGLDSGSTNVIANHLRAAITLAGSNTLDNAILGNSIYENVLHSTGASIDLGWSTSTGPNPIDSLDGDVGANNFQNHPILNSAVLTGTGLTISGRIHTSSNGSFRIEFFANPTAHPSTYGEGRYFIGAIDSVSTDVLGKAVFSETLPVFIQRGWTVTATATSTSSNTSEFSQYVIVSADDTDGDGLPDDFETEHGLNLALDDGGADPDGDGLSNLAELRLGTDPKSFSEPLAPRLVFGGSETEVQFDSEAGRLYRVVYRDGFEAGSDWQVMADYLRGDGAPISCTDPSAGSVVRRFYRLEQLP